MDGHEFHKISVIESLRGDDLQTGTRLVQNQLLDARLRHEHLEVEHLNPTTKEVRLVVLKNIRDDALHQGTYPLIHFECHGDSEGLETTNGDHLAWEEMRRLLIEINHACRLNLLIVIAACNGIHLIKACTKLDRAPFYAAIGPNTEIKAGAIDFAVFYTTFFSGLNGDEAMHAINKGKFGADRTYHFFTSFGLFAKAYRKYHDEFRVGKGHHLHKEASLTEALAFPQVKAFGVNTVRKQVKRQMAEEDRYFLEYRDRFFSSTNFRKTRGASDIHVSRLSS